MMLALLPKTNKIAFPLPIPQVQGTPLTPTPHSASFFSVCPPNTLYHFVLSDNVFLREASVIFIIIYNTICIWEKLRLENLQEHRLTQLE